MQLSRAPFVKVLRIKSDEYWTRKQAQEKEEFLRKSRETKQIAEAIIRDLPSFLQRVVEDGFNYAYIVQLNQYEPWQFQYQKTHPNVPCFRQDWENGILTPYRLRSLFGVPREVARWGMSQGFDVTVNSETGSSEKVVFRPHQTRADNVGIVFHW